MATITHRLTNEYFIEGAFYMRTTSFSCGWFKFISNMHERWNKYISTHETMEFASRSKSI